MQAIEAIVLSSNGAVLAFCVWIVRQLWTIDKRTSLIEFQIQAFENRLENVKEVARLNVPHAKSQRRKRS